MIFSSVINKTDSNLFDLGLWESDVKAVIDEGAHLLILSVVTDADDRDATVLDYADQLGDLNEKILPQRKSLLCSLQPDPRFPTFHPLRP